MNKVVVTGAASLLGSFAVRHLLAGTTREIVAVSSGRSAPPADLVNPRVTWLRADLSRGASPALQDALRVAHRVLHFAWTRSGPHDQVLAANSAMIRALVAPLSDPCRLWFVSSVSASPNAFSTYGRTKYECMQLVESLGASTLVCGLVVEEHPAKGPYRMLRDTVARFPFALRAVGGGPLVFPIRLDDMGAVLVQVCEIDLPAGNYRMFSEPLRFNEFLKLLEAVRPRTRLPLPFSARLAIAAAAFGKRTRLLPDKLGDQVMTFLYKDDVYLLAHRRVHGVQLQACTGPAFFRDLRMHVTQAS
ncbi:MAG: NAD-dependent epimerase/dehydratase family protein [Steroidobacteraceae bacterium]